MLSLFQKSISRPAVLSAVSSQIARFLNLHEYQSKELMEKAGAVVQKGKMADSAAKAREIAEWILRENPSAELVVKAQIHAGGRGKGTFKDGFKGGVQIARTAEEVEKYAKKMLGNTLVTKQTGPAGQVCAKVLINEGIKIEKEMYFAILMDRSVGGPCMVASTEGGMDIEEVAKKNPKAILTQPVDIMKGVQDEQVMNLAKRLGFTGDLQRKAANQMKALYNLFIKSDSTQVEINPLAVGYVPGKPEKHVYAVDAKLNFDDSASFRQKDIFSLRDRSMEDPRDLRAEELGLNYVGLDGNIGCLVNGAGLAMATMDIIHHKGGMPANFLDVGGSATKHMVAEAFKIITADPKVKAILINIFGGIMRCDIIAEGISAAFKEVGLKVPLVVRLDGTNSKEGRAILEKSKLPIITAGDLDEAAEKAVAAAKH